MSVTRRRAEHRTVLELADDALESPVALQGDVLRVLIADGAETAIQVGIRNARATQPAGGISVRCHV